MINSILELLKYCTSGFCVFCGTLIILIILMISINGISHLVIRTYRLIMVSFHGWPPSHLDADGDWKSEPKKSEK